MAGAAALLVAAAGGEGRAQIVTENAGPAGAPDTPIFRESFSLYETDHLLDLRLNHDFIFTVTPRDELRLTLPTVLQRRVEFQGGGRRRGSRISARRLDTEETSGLGDMSLRLKHVLYQTDDVMASDRWAAIGELVFPTGDSHERVGSARLPRHLQLGYGSWGLGVGTAYTLIRDRHRFATDFYFKYRNRNEGFRLGETLIWNLAYWYRITPVQFDPECEQVELRGVIELLNTYQFDSETSRGDAGDGGFENWIAPGLQLFLRRDILIEGNVQFPVIQNMDDEMGDRRFRCMLAVKFLF